MIIITIIKLMVILCIVATIHEFGHFLAAKLQGIGVKEFSIGFGPKIVSKQFKETMYSLRWLPLGGYVMIEGEGEECDTPTSYSNKNPLQKIIVLIMGVVFNFILAFFVLMAVYLNIPTSNSKITALDDNSVLLNTDIKINDTITKINGKNIKLGTDLLNQRFIDNDKTTIEYLNSNNELKTVVVDNAVKNIGLIGAVFKDNNTVDTLIKNRPAHKGKLKEGDIVIKIDDTAVNSSTHIVDIIKNSANKELKFLVKRDGKEIELKITPAETKKFDLGINSTEVIGSNIKYAFISTMRNVEQVFNSYIDIFRGKVSVDDVSSIVGIGSVVSKSEGLLEFFNLIAIISLAIGAANLLPIVPLDGGKIFLVLVEVIIRRKVPEKVELAISYIGMFLLLALTFVVTCSDISVLL